MTPKRHSEINWSITAPKNSCSFIFCDNSYWSQVTSISSYKLNIFRNRTCRTCICHIPGILQYVYLTNMRHELFREGYLLLAFLKQVHILANLSMILAFHFLLVKSLGFKKTMNWQYQIPCKRGLYWLRSQYWEDSADSLNFFLIFLISS